MPRHPRCGVHFAVLWILAVLPCIACSSRLLVVAFVRSAPFLVANEHHWHVRFITHLKRLGETVLLCICYYRYKNPHCFAMPLVVCYEPRHWTNYVTMILCEDTSLNPVKVTVAKHRLARPTQSPLS